MIKDKLFLLSATEVDKYLPTKENRICKYKSTPIWWWLRSPGCSTDDAAYVSSNGYLYRDGGDVDSNYRAVRPALHINPSSLQSLERTKKGYIRFGGKKWMVLDEETGLLLAKKAVCLSYFDAKSNNYEVSEIRAYLNGKLIEEFDLHTDEKQKMIVDTVIDGEKSYPVA